MNYYKQELQEVEDVINAVNAAECKKKTSKEERKAFQLIYSPVLLNKKFKEQFNRYNWHPQSVKCDYSKCGEFLNGYVLPELKGVAPYREMDFVKAGTKIGVEVQFGKYAFMVYNVCSKMTIFKNLNIIEAGIEIVPVRNFTQEMSSGVSYFEQFAWDLTTRGVSNIDIPVLILGIDV